jgi:hypothetical protein
VTQALPRSATAWRCRIRKGSVRPRLNIVPLHTHTQQAHETLRSNMLSVAHEMADEETISGYMVVTVTMDGRMNTAAQLAPHCRFGPLTFPSAASEAARLHLLYEGE